MKNYDELTKDLLERRDYYVAEQKKRRKAATKITTSLCCCSLVALLGFGIWQNGMFDDAVPDQTLNDALHPGIQNTIDDNNGEAAANNKIVINDIRSLTNTDHSIALMRDDFIEMSREEMIAYYGFDYIPDVPADIKAWKDEHSGIYKRYGGTGEVYWDADILNYANDDFTRTVHLQVDKDSKVFVDVVFMGEEENSIINNIEVIIGLTDDGWYYAEFMYKNVGFLLSADGVTEDEFIGIITSIIQ